MKPNILLITVDDMNYDSLNCYGSKVRDVTPNIDKLAMEGVKFNHSHVTIAVCQPSRSSIMTGMYPHKNGARGFEPIDTRITTLTEILRDNNYVNGIIGKEDHLKPKEKFAWDYYISTYNDENDFGRNPKKYYFHTKEFLKKAKSQGVPFFLMANSHDPHRPFAGSDDEINFFGRHTNCTYEYKEEDVEVPGFLPDIPLIRKEIAQYYTSVRRGDETVGEILKALEEEGYRENTVVIFLSDNGMAFPFAKTNCYLNSTKSPWIFRWPKHIKSGVECDALLSGIDIAPTILDILELQHNCEMDGKSFKELLFNIENEHCETIYTSFFKTAKNKITGMERYYPMRCVRDKRFSYIFNSWSDETNIFVNESMSGLTFNAMKEVAETDKEIEKRVNFYKYRVVEELYDCEKDPDALNNLIGSPDYGEVLNNMRKLMYGYMESTGDELISDFKDKVDFDC